MSDIPPGGGAAAVELAGGRGPPAPVRKSYYIQRKRHTHTQSESVFFLFFK